MAVARATSCEPHLEVSRIRTVRLTTEVRTYQFARDPKSRVRLEVTVEPTTLDQLAAAGLYRRSRAARALNWTDPLAELSTRPLTMVRLRFEPTEADLMDLRARPSLRETITDRFARQLDERARLLAEAVTDVGDRPVVFHFTFGYDVLAWRDLEEFASLGETRFATRTWLAQTLRTHGVKGAIMIAGSMPEESTPMARGPTRYPFDYVRRSGRGPEVLFFRPSRP